MRVVRVALLASINALMSWAVTGAAGNGKARVATAKRTNSFFITDIFSLILLSTRVNKSLEVLAEKYQLVVEREGSERLPEPPPEIKRIINWYYTSLKKASYGQTKDISEKLVTTINNMSHNADQAGRIISFVINATIGLAKSQNDNATIQRLRDVSKIMSSGLGANLPGLN